MAEKNNNGSKKAVISLAIIFLLILAFIVAISPSSARALVIYLIFLIIIITVYSIGQTQKYCYGLGYKKAGVSILFGIIGLFTFYFITLLIPGFSIGFPTLPAAVTDELRWFVVNIVAPFVESMFFVGALLGFIFSYKFFREHKILAIILFSVAFALFHLGAYIIGFENLTSLNVAFSIFSVNLAPFFAAFLFMFITGIVIVYFIPNLLFAIVFHFVNFLIYYRNLSVTVI